MERLEDVMGARILKLRKSRKLTEDRFVEKIGVGYSTYRFWIDNKTCPSSYSIRAICKEFGVSADYLLGLKDEET